MNRGLGAGVTNGHCATIRLSDKAEKVAAGCVKRTKLIIAASGGALHAPCGTSFEVALLAAFVANSS
jgi:hypothetical protein